MDGAQSSSEQASSEQALIASYFGWWQNAGLVDPVGDRPCDWLLAPATAPTVARAPVAHTAKLVPIPPVRATGPRLPAPPQPLAALPATLVAFDSWLATSPDLPGADWSSARCLPAGPGNAALMILSDAPDLPDIATAQLFSGAAGRLLDAMLAAIGRTRADVRLASIALTRPVGGRLSGPECDRLLAIAQHHIALVRPTTLLLLGQQADQLLGGGSQRFVNHNGGIMAMHAIPHPRLLLDRPLLKRHAWDVLKTLKEPG
jgi:uracil-DNA glycosylase